MPLWELLHRYDFSKLPPLSEIPRVVNPTADVFTRYFVPLAAPIVITDSPVFATGPRTLEDVVLRNADKIHVSVRGGDYVDVNKRQQDRMPLSNYIDRYVNPSERDGDLGGNGELPRYAGNTRLTHDDFQALGFQYPECFEGKEFIEPRLWFGPRGSLTALHYDPTDNLVCQYIGTKHFILYPPSQIPYLYTRGSAPTWCDVVDPRRVDLNKFPLFANARAVEVTLKAREMLFLPARWAHFVVNLDTSLMVNFWPKYLPPPPPPRDLRTQVKRVKRKACRYALGFCEQLYGKTAVAAEHNGVRR
jgi:hypothetical protein